MENFNLVLIGDRMCMRQKNETCNALSDGMLFAIESRSNCLEVFLSALCYCGKISIILREFCCSARAAFSCALNIYLKGAKSEKSIKIEFCIFIVQVATKRVTAYIHHREYHRIVKLTQTRQQQRTNFRGLLLYWDAWNLHVYTIHESRWYS